MGFDSKCFSPLLSFWDSPLPLQVEHLLKVAQYPAAAAPVVGVTEVAIVNSDAVMRLNHPKTGPWENYLS